MEALPRFPSSLCSPLCCWWGFFWSWGVAVSLDFAGWHICTPESGWICPFLCLHLPSTMPMETHEGIWPFWRSRRHLASPGSEDQGLWLPRPSVGSREKKATLELKEKGKLAFSSDKRCPLIHNCPLLFKVWTGLESVWGKSPGSNFLRKSC